MTCTDTSKSHHETKDPKTAKDSPTEKALDEALKETFPASDPVSIGIDKLPPIKTRNPHAAR